VTVHISTFISVINQPDAQNICFTISFISRLYMFRAHVLIIRRSKLHYTASGIITPNLFHSKFYFMPLFVSSTCAHHQEVKIVLYSLWYHHTYRWPSHAQVERGLSGMQEHIFLHTRQSSLNLCMGRPPIGVMIPEAI